MLNPGLSALWEEEQARREFLNIKTPLETPDNEGKVSGRFTSIFLVPCWNKWNSYSNRKNECSGGRKRNRI